MRSTTAFSMLIFLLASFSSNLFGKAANYFQQEVHYTLDVHLDDHTHFLRGTEQVIYSNNSPDTLSCLYFHLWPNAYRDEETVLAKIYRNDADTRLIKAMPEGSGFIDSLDFSVSQHSLRWEVLPDTPDVARIYLEQALLPGQSVTIATPFRVKIPSSGISRLGHNGQSYFITQWYPKPAVYDRDGWKYIPYVDKGEFYSEFGSFDVTLTLPENYVVGATGHLTGCDQEINWLNEKAKETTALVNFSPDSMSFPPSSAVNKTLHYTQDRVHDFAWFADKRWHVLKDSVELPHSKRNVMVWAFFTNRQAAWWMKSTLYMKRAMLSYSGWLGDYPYNQVTAVDVTDAEGSDMEYPMITAIGTASSPLALDNVLAHELGHNWLYGVLGNDERRHAWMDEGINSFYEKRYMFTTYAGDSTKMKEYFNRMGRWGKWTKNTRSDLRLKQYMKYLGDARTNTDQSPGCRSEEFTLRNYSDIVYGKTSLGFQYLKAYLGDSLFDTCMHHYFDEWKFRHPGPQDIQFSLEQSSGKNLGWLFEGWLAGTGKLNYKVCAVKATEDSFHVHLRNKGKIHGPIGIAISDSTEKIRTIWMDGFRKDSTLTILGRPSLPHLIDPERWMPEVNRKDNSFQGEGVLKKVEPLRLQWLTGVEDPDRTPLYYAPAAGWNLYNGPMAGAVLHNIGYPQKAFEFALMPLFAFRTKDLNGGGFISYRIHPDGGWFREIRLRAGLQHYAYRNDEYNNVKNISYRSTNYFSRLENRIDFSFKNNTPRNRMSKTLTLRQLIIQRDIPYAWYYQPNEHTYNYYQITYQQMFNHPWNGYSHLVSFTANNDFVRIWLQGEHRFPYADKKKGIEIRGRMGWTSIRNPHAPDVDYRFRLSGWGGKDDYLFDQVFLGRTEQTGILSQQFVPTDGGFTTNTDYYRLADTWMITLGIKAAIPGKLPLWVYANAATFNDAEKGFDQAQQVSLEGGVEIRLIKDIFAVYLPMVYSKDIRYVIDRESLSFAERIRFQINLHALNPLEKLND
jgi:hypothetical protein